MKIEFNKCIFGAQIHNVPMICMNEEFGFDMDTQIGKVKEIDMGEVGTCLGRYLRIGIQVDVTKPLERGFNVELNDDKSVHVIVQYERLPNYCFDYGKLGHLKRECPDEELNRDYNPHSKVKYVDWLQVPYQPHSRTQSNHPTSSPPSKNPQSKTCPKPNQRLLKIKISHIVGIFFIFF